MPTPAPLRAVADVVGGEGDGAPKALSEGRFGDPSPRPAPCNAVPEDRLTAPLCR